MSMYLYVQLYWKAALVHFDVCLVSTSYLQSWVIYASRPLLHVCSEHANYLWIFFIRRLDLNCV